MNTYDIYKNGDLIERNATVTTLKNITGLSYQSIPKYIGLEKGYRKDGNLYTYTHGVIMDSHKRPNSGAINENKQYHWPPKLIEEWNDRCAAADGIRKDTHHIVTKYLNGKWEKVTEAIK